MNTWFFSFGLPFLILGALLGGGLYALFASMMYSYLKDNYSDALPPRIDVFLNDYEAMGGFMAGIWYAQRTGGWKRIESRVWRYFFVATQSLGLFAMLCCVAFCAAFLFMPR
jgi:hypothetical protein